MSRAVSIRAQLKKYMQRFGLSIESCQGDAKRLRRCLVGGYWRNAARWVADGTYRSIRDDKVSLCAITVMLIILTATDIARPSYFCAFYPQAPLRMGHFP
jgi:hypothetical protein